MSMRISELENEEVDYLRFDRIKIQRKRMEHILEVIKDLTFKNRELVRQTNQLKADMEEDKHYRHLFEEVNTERKVLIERNLALADELGKYRQTALHQEILINTLKEELQSQQHRNRHCKNQFYKTEPEFNFKACSYLTQDEPLISEQYEILKAQYKDLQDEYSHLFKQQFNRREKENLDLTGHIYTKNDISRQSTDYLLKKVRSTKALDLDQMDQTVNLVRLRQKYEKVKKIKKQLSKELKLMEGQLQGYKSREENLLALIEVLKEKKTKICLCHINKLEKQLELKSIMLEHGVDQT